VKQRKALDILVRNSLRTWPQCPPGLQAPRGEDAWLRGRPAEDLGTCHPFLKLPGSNKLRTLPDGLWLHFGGTAEDPFVDIFAIEACSSLQNLLDKRSRFAPSVQSLLPVCPVPWLLAPVQPGDPMPRWKATRVIRFEPVLPLSTDSQNEAGGDIENEATPGSRRNLRRRRRTGLRQQPGTAFLAQSVAIAPDR
jgi:hypothetical protein